jgi:DNA-binding IclR family transcriptional regulator
MSVNAWDAVEHAILRAVQQQPATCREIADRAGVTPDVAKTQIDALRSAGLVTQAVDAGVRYRITLAGHKRLSVLTDRPGHQAAA